MGLKQCDSVIILAGYGLSLSHFVQIVFSQFSKFLTDSWLGLSTVEKTDGLNVGRCNVSIDTCDSNGLSLDPLGVFEFPVDPLESEYLISPRALGVSAPTRKTRRSVHES